MKEIVARISIVAAILLIPAAIIWFQHAIVPSGYPKDVKVINLTAVGEGVGAYTLDSVNGLNYWWKQFSPATIFLEQGDKAVLRILSADVTHQFYVPALNIGPVNVRPGHTGEYFFTANKPGHFQYFCMTMCGPCHFYMTGWIVVTATGAPVEIPPPITCPICYSDFDTPPPEDKIELGEYLFLQKGCVTCHGINAAGGIKNYNYAKQTIPAHNKTVEKLFLRSEEDTEEFSEILTLHDDLEELQELPAIPLIHVVLDRYRALQNIIELGSHPEKLNQAGPEPPLIMPAWKYQLSEREIQGLILYFISLYQWEEEEFEET